MIDTVTVIGSGRVGSAVRSRLEERGVAVGDELVLLCVPDAAIADVAASVPPGPWVAHVSGATPLAALEPHVRRFSVHPLQTFDRSGDAEIAEAAGVDVLFAPDADELYPPGFSTWVDPGETGAEGRARPGHFRGVATVCLKLFNVVRPTRAYFGQKDAQQAAVLKQVVRDLNVPVRIRILPTVRDDDGLALSSRNVRLSPAERERALALPRALHASTRAPDPVGAAEAMLDGLQPEYVEVVDLGGAKVLAAAVRVGATRLIDNVLLEGALS